MENTNSIDDINKLRKIFEGKQTITMGSLIKQNGEPAEPGQETLDTLLKQHYPTGEPLQPTSYPNTGITLTELKNSDLESWINNDLIIKVFDGFKSKKSPGTDKLKPIVYKLSLIHI